MAGRALIKVPWRAALHDAAAVDDGDLVRHRQRLVLVVSHEDEGRPELLVQRPQLFLETGSQVLVERRQRLVEQQDARLEDECAGESDPLLLATGQLARHPFAEALEVRQRQQAVDLAADDVLAGAAHPQGEADVLAHRHGRKEGIALEDHAEIALLRRQSSDVPVAKPDTTCRRRNEARDHHQDRRLAGARRAKERQERAGGDVERDVVHGGESAVALAHTLQRQCFVLASHRDFLSSSRGCGKGLPDRKRLCRTSRLALRSSCGRPRTRHRARAGTDLRSPSWRIRGAALWPDPARPQPRANRDSLRAQARRGQERRRSSRRRER